MNHDEAAEIESILNDVALRLKEIGKERGRLIPILQMIQEKHAYLPAEAIRLVAEHLEMAPCEVYGVATFYNQFRFHPPGKHPIKVCLGTACHIRGADRIVEEIERNLGIRPGETSRNGEFSLETVMCLGCCAIGPVVVIDGRYYGEVTPTKVESILKTIREEVYAR